MSKTNSYNRQNMTQRDPVLGRLTRLESKLVRGFEELGVSLDVDKDWLTVDDASNTIYVSTIGRSLLVTIQEMKARGATKVGEHYDVVHRGQVIATVLYEPKF